MNNYEYTKFTIRKRLKVDSSSITTAILPMDSGIDCFFRGAELFDTSINSASPAQGKTETFIFKFS